jgi:hypothetical protein
MSVTLAETPTLVIRRYVGPARVDRGHRQLFEIVNKKFGGGVALDWEQLGTVIEWLAASDSQKLLLGPGIED